MYCRCGVRRPLGSRTNVSNLCEASVSMLELIAIALQLQIVRLDSHVGNVKNPMNYQFIKISTIKAHLPCPCPVTFSPENQILRWARTSKQRPDTPSLLCLRILASRLSNTYVPLYGNDRRNMFGRVLMTNPQ